MKDRCNNAKLCCTKIENFNVVKDEIYIIKDVNIHVHCSEITAIVGPNGAGKSTLLKAILSDVEHTGNIIFESHGNHHIRKPIIGYVPQTLEFDKLYPMTVCDLLILAMQKEPIFFARNDKTLKSVDEILSVVQANELKYKKIGQLSGGELQRVVLALALNPIPDILLLDEPVSGIDHNGLQLFYRIVSNLRMEYDMTILLVSHDFDLVKKYSDKVILLDKKILVQGKPEEVFKNSEFSRIFGEVISNV